MSQQNPPYRLNLRVVPNASKSEFSSYAEDVLKVRIQAPATDGRANKALLAFLSKALNIPKRAISIEKGKNSRQKVIAIEGFDPTDFLQQLGATDKDS